MTSGRLEASLRLMAAPIASGGAFANGSSGRSMDWRGELRSRREGHRRRLAAQIVILRGRDHADDLVERGWIAGFLDRAERLPDRTGAAQIPAHEGPIHYGDARGGGGIAVAEATAADDRNAHGIEIAGADPCKGASRLVPIVWPWVIPPAAPARTPSGER